MHTETYHAFMLDHATGALSPALHLAGDLHRTLDSRGARTANIWDNIGGLFLDSALDDMGGDDLKDKSQNRRAGRKTPAPSAVGAASILAVDLDEISWRRGLSGIEYAKAGLPEGQFMRLQAGQTTPEHGHSATEATVVLRGELIVEDEIYRPGQLVIGTPGERHQPQGGHDGDCICYVGRESRPFWRLS